MSEEERKNLKDLKEIKIDGTLPEKERIQSFVSQIRDPYQFRIDDAAVRISFSDTENTITDSVISMINRMDSFYG